MISVIVIWISVMIIYISHRNIEQQCATFYTASSITSSRKVHGRVLETLRKLCDHFGVAKGAEVAKGPKGAKDIQIP